MTSLLVLVVVATSVVGDCHDVVVVVADVDGCGDGAGIGVRVVSLTGGWRARASGGGSPAVPV